MRTDLYPHMPILRPHAARYSTNGASLAWRLRRRISTVMFTARWARPARWPIRPILGFWRNKVDKNVWFHASVADEPPRKKLTSLALSSAEKSVTVQTQKNKQKKQTNSKRYIHTLPIGMCGWKGFAVNCKWMGISFKSDLYGVGLPFC